MSQQLLLEGITAQQVFDDNIADLKLSWISGLEGADRTFDTQAVKACLLYTSPSPRDLSTSRMPSSA